MNKKENRRFQETEIRMENAMLSLLKHTEFEKITVKKICEEAKINRSTFYAHFEDIYDMLDRMEGELGKELLESYEGYEGKQETLIFSEPSLIRFLKHIKKHRYFYRINLQTRKSFPLKRGFDQLWEMIAPRCKKAGISGDEEILFYFIYFQAGFTMVLKHWVDTDCKMKEEEVASILKNCIPHMFSNE